MVQDPLRPTTVKSRISGASFHSVTQQIVRIDRLDTSAPSKEIEDKIIENIEKAVPLHDAVILSDYNIGLLTDRVIEATVACAKHHGKIVVADVQKDMFRYKGVYALTPNQPDSEKAAGYFIKDAQTLNRAGSDILEMTDAQVLLLTRGGDGMAVFEKVNQNMWMYRYLIKQVFLMLPVPEILLLRHLPLHLLRVPLQNMLLLSATLRLVL